MSEIERLQRRLEREKQARKAAELIAEEKTREIYETNVRLQELNQQPGGARSAAHDRTRRSA